MRLQAANSCFRHIIGVLNEKEERKIVSIGDSTGSNMLMVSLDLD